MRVCGVSICLRVTSWWEHTEGGEKKDGLAEVRSHTINNLQFRNELRPQQSPQTHENLPLIPFGSTIPCSSPSCAGKKKANRGEYQRGTATLAISDLRLPEAKPARTTRLNCTRKRNGGSEETAESKYETQVELWTYQLDHDGR